MLRKSCRTVTCDKAPSLLFTSMSVATLSNGHANGDVPMDPPTTQGASMRFASGLILPPPEIKSVIDRTAGFVARSANPPQFEDKIRENMRSNPQFSFLNPADPYHAYYRNRMEKVSNGEIIEDSSAKVDKEGDLAASASAKANGEAAMEVDFGVEAPPAAEFVMDLPTIAAIDLDVMKLTALFTAQRGRGFLAALSAREGRNYQFDFLRPTHSLFGYFNRLVEQYTKVINPSKATLEQLQERTKREARWKTLEQAKKHAKWDQVKKAQDKKRQEDQEVERIAFAEIDWHDYAIVQTIEFTAADQHSELPAPMSVQDIENMTLMQKQSIADVMESTVEDVEAHRAKLAAAEAQAAASVTPEPGVETPKAGSDVAMSPVDEDEEERKRKEELERIKEIQRAQALQSSSINVAGPMKIRTDYVPKLGAKNTKSVLTKCEICGQQIPVDELQEHMRIELLDPRWKSQRDALEARKAQASELQRGANVVSSLKKLANTRVDIFGAEADEERRKKEEEEERERRRQRERVVWDGHTNTKADTLDKFSSNVNFDEQIAAIHRAKGLGPQDANAIGPGIGPASAPPPILPTLPPAPASLPAPPIQHGGGAAYTAATVSSGPQPATAYASQPVMLPPLHYQPMDAAQPFGYQPPPPGMQASRPVAGIASSASGSVPTPPPPAPQAGTIRPADEMDTEDGAPPAKRQKIGRLPGGQLYAEADWISSHPHPISVRVQLPEDTTKPEWKLDGSTITLQDLPLDLLISTLRERILRQLDSRLSASRLRLSFEGKMLTNKNSMAFYNIEDDDILYLTVAPQKK